MVTGEANLKEEEAHEWDAARVLLLSAAISKVFGAYWYCAVVLFAQILQQSSLARKVSFSNNFDERPNGGIFRPPAMFMFYDFAPHGNGANNRRPPAAVHERLALCLLFVSECVIPGVVVGESPA